MIYSSGLRLISLNNYLWKNAAEFFTHIPYSVANQHSFLAHSYRLLRSTLNAVKYLVMFLSELESKLSIF
ncbi:MAG: hypothetical protein ACJAR1_001744 [Rubritalea sp.]|jgi:hypothetical protein